MKPQICKNCERFKLIYVKMWYKYSGINRYFCVLRGELKEAEHTCDKWQRKIKREPDLSCGRFEKAKNDIEFLLGNIE